MSNKSSIEWLMFQLYEQGLLKGDGNKMDELLEQAKEMHKQEIYATFAYAYKLGYIDDGDNRIEYYNETFGK